VVSIDMDRMAPRAREALQYFAKTSGLDDEGRTVEELVFAMKELLTLIDTTKDPMLEPEAARKQMDVMRGILQRFKRFEHEVPK
jgi:hypothetical protein